MRNIKFRGKTTDSTNRWVYGVPVAVGEYVEMHWFDFEKQKMMNVLVAPETIGEFTGLTDKNGKEIYEGDIFPYRNIVTYLADDKEGYGMAAGWYAQRDNFESWSELEGGGEEEVIGNIYDNPELLNR
jgi:uncharacterized phage protein (TIGR01671 family)